MVKYKVKLSKEARASLNEIYDWLKENESLSIAKKVKNGILITISGLVTMPQRNGIFHEISKDEVIYRKALKWSYKIVYVIDEEEIEVIVVAIIHSKVDLQSIRSQFEE
jgi:plasmid stabilization system protein ParE